jgi:hypothetical protein
MLGLGPNETSAPAMTFFPAASAERACARGHQDVCGLPAVL